MWLGVVVSGAAITVMLAACAAPSGGAPAETTSGDTAPVATSTLPATTSVATTQPSTPAPTTPPATTHPDGGLEVATVAAWIQRLLDAEFAATDPPPGVLGAYQVICEDQGRLETGDVLACRGEPRTEPDFQLDPTGVVVYVLDHTGRAAWSAGTDVPDTTSDLLALHEAAPHGLFCRDLMSPDGTGSLFDGYGRPDDSAYFWSLVYWSLEGRPDRMDADHDGIPCETVHSPAVVADVLAGGPTF